MPRFKLTLSVDRELTDRMKIQAVREHRDLSDMVEELIQQYLDRFEGVTRKTQVTKPEQ